MHDMTLHDLDESRKQDAELQKQHKKDLAILTDLMSRGKLTLCCGTVNEIVLANDTFLLKVKS
jgi:hypothetical protein